MDSRPIIDNADIFDQKMPRQIEKCNATSPRASMETQTSSFYVHPLIGQITVDHGRVPQHMHTVCDILPCPRGSSTKHAICGTCCPKQQYKLRSSSLEHPIQLAAPVTGCFEPSSGDTDGKMKVPNNGGTEARIKGDSCLDSSEHSDQFEIERSRGDVETQRGDNHTSLAQVSQERIEDDARASNGRIPGQEMPKSDANDRIAETIDKVWFIPRLFCIVFFLNAFVGKTSKI